MWAREENALALKDFILNENYELMGSLTLQREISGCWCQFHVITVNDCM